VRSSRLAIRKASKFETRIAKPSWAAGARTPGNPSPTINQCPVGLSVSVSRPLPHPDMEARMDGCCRAVLVKKSARVHRGSPDIIQPPLADRMSLAAERVGVFSLGHTRWKYWASRDVAGVLGVFREFLKYTYDPAQSETAYAIKAFKILATFDHFGRQREVRFVHGWHAFGADLIQNIGTSFSFQLATLFLSMA